MQPYQNFYQNPMYNNNPYMQRMDYLQQFHQNLQPTQPVTPNQQYIPMGKIVESVDMVKATDIPMDGNMYYFPTADGNSVYGKRWLPNGQTQIMTFKPILDDEANNSTPNQFELNFGAISEVLNGIQNDVKELANKVDKISRPSRKKEVVEDE